VDCGGVTIPLLKQEYLTNLNVLEKTLVRQSD